MYAEDEVYKYIYVKRMVYIYTCIKRIGIDDSLENTWSRQLLYRPESEQVVANDVAVGRSYF